MGAARRGRGRRHRNASRPCPHRRADGGRGRLLPSAAPRREALLSIAAEAHVDLAGSSEVARLLRCALERESVLEEEERIGRRAASAAVMRAAVTGSR